MQATSLFDAAPAQAFTFAPFGNAGNCTFAYSMISEAYLQKWQQPLNPNFS
jgi:hypothetical protein